MRGRAASQRFRFVGAVPPRSCVNVLEKAQKLLRCRGLHWARSVEGGEEGGGAVTDVAMRDAFDVSEPKGQQSGRRNAWVWPSVVGWVEVESDDIVDLLEKNGSVESMVPLSRRGEPWT